MMNGFTRTLVPALLLAAALCGCGTGASEGGSDASGAAVSSVLSEEDTAAAASSVSSVAPEETEEETPVSSALIPENLTEEYSALLSGLWVDADTGDSYYINADGSGSLYPSGGEEGADFTWNVLAQQEGEDLLYLFFTGGEAAECYLPVFDEGSLTLCDPDSGEAVISLTVGETFG